MPMRSCRTCIYHSEYFCKKVQIHISSYSNAIHCPHYVATKTQENMIKRASKAVCIKCKRMNINGWCEAKRKCISWEDRNKQRQCIKFIYK